MKRSVTLLEVLLVLAFISEAPWAISGSLGCKPSRSRAFRPHSVRITEFGAVGDGITLNTNAFQNAIFYLRSFANKGGAQLFVPAGKWLTGSFNLISHLTLMLDKEAVILGSMDSGDWPVVDPLPSYGRGRELPGRRHQSLIYGDNLTDVIITDSSDDVCIEDCYISTGDDVIAIKSGWDEYGISYGRPSTNIFIRRVTGETTSSSGIALGSEMSGGISEVHVEGIQLFNSKNGIRVKTSPGRGGYIRNVYISDVTMTDVEVAIKFTGQYGQHPDDNYDPNALPIIKRITFKDITGKNIRFAGKLQGIEGDSFHNICLSNITLDVISDPPWNCSYIRGYSRLVSPKSCEPLRKRLPKDSLACYSSSPLPSKPSEGRRLVSTM
ncbi:probable polygalacturonase isoform X2 [Magnolia sinica]|uniref:probable polygalacturonase isoform X2 n=1 Tax=Magnolia sinica TaxID=86752 RepID=UPI002658A38C|nr:probable polygalacturonase isoform X2 [Magnolia sinica]